MKKKTVKAIMICIIFILSLSLCACGKGKPTFSGLVKAVKSSREPYLVETCLSYSESGVVLSNTFKLEIGKTKDGFAAKYTWENQEAAPFESGGQIAYSSGSGIFAEKSYKSLCERLRQSGHNFQYIGAHEFEIKREYFLSFEFSQSEGEERYYFYGELNGIGKKEILGKIQGEISEAFIEMEVVKEEQKVVKIILSYQYEGGEEVKISLAYGYDLQEIDEET